MKVSRLWLQNYFEESLPNAEAIADALTFHAFEIEEIEHHDGDAVLDVKVLPDRAAYALSHRGIAREVGASLGLDLVKDPLHETLPDFQPTAELSVEIEDLAKCPLYSAALVRGVKVGPSPEWLKIALESVGQRSINNVVDATNYVMLDIGQPLHAFDAANLVQKDGAYAIKVRSSRATGGSTSDSGGSTSEKITTLSGDEFELPENILLITDAHTDRGIGIAGVKGGKAAAITEATTDIIIESANFDGTLVRKASQRLKLWTDASQRYQNKPSPLLARYGMRDVIELIIAVAGGELVGVTEVSAPIASAVPVEISVAKINAVLGASIGMGEIARVFDLLALSFTLKISEGVFTVIPPFERRDIMIPEDLIEEVGRIVGYDHVDPEPLPEFDGTADQTRFKGIERIKDFLVERGFSEISTQTFAEKGDIVLANPLDQTRPALRTNLHENMQAALARAKVVAPRVLGPVSEVKLFEIGTVFTEEGEAPSESLSLVVGRQVLSGKQNPVLTENADELGGLFSAPIYQDGEMIEILLHDADLAVLGLEKTESAAPRKVALGSYKPFSLYPFALRDIAVWTPAGTEESEVANVIIGAATNASDANDSASLLARIDLFDRFEKKDADGIPVRTSFAFRLVFESSDRTLSDEDLNPIMEKITTALNSREGYEVR